MDNDPSRSAALVAALDQADAALRVVAGMLGDYRRQLVEAGFSSDDALELCVDLQRIIIFHEINPGD